MDQATRRILSETYPGLVVCLVKDVHKNWTELIPDLLRLPEGHLTTIVPVTAGDEIHPWFEPLLTPSASYDFILEYGHPQSSLVTTVREKLGLPTSSVLDEVDFLSPILPARSPNPVDVNFLLGHGPSALPIPMTAITHRVPDHIGSSVATGTRRHSPRNRHVYFDFEQICDIYKRLAGTKSSQRAIVVGCGDDVLDMCMYWNVLARHGADSLWLPRPLFSKPALAKTLKFLSDLSLGGWEARMFNFECSDYEEYQIYSTDPRLASTIESDKRANWHRWDGTRVTSVYFTMKDWASLRPVVTTCFRPHREEELMAVADEQRWTIALPSVPDEYGNLGITSLVHPELGNLPGRLADRLTDGTVRPNAHGLFVYRAQQPSILHFLPPSDFAAIREWLPCKTTPSDKAGSILALIRQLGGVDRASTLLSSPAFYQLVQDCSLESVHRWLKCRLAPLFHEAQGVDAGTKLDEVVRQLGDRIRRDRKTWFSFDELRKKGISPDEVSWLTKAGVFEKGVRLICPECGNKACYPPRLLADFVCSLCGWRGIAPLPEQTTAVFYAVKDLVMKVATDGSIPVILAMKKLGGGHLSSSRVFPGCVLHWGGHSSEVDIVSVSEGELQFWEVKHNATQVIDELDAFLALCDSFGAQPGIAAMENTDDLQAYLTKGHRSCLVMKVGLSGRASVSP